MSVPAQGACGAKRQGHSDCPLFRGCPHALLPVRALPTLLPGGRKQEQGFKCWLCLLFSRPVGRVHTLSNTSFLIRNTGENAVQWEPGEAQVTWCEKDSLVPQCLTPRFAGKGRTSRGSCGQREGGLASGQAAQPPGHLPCLQKPRSYQGQSLILDSGSMCRKGHSLLLHSPAGKPRHASTWESWTQTHLCFSCRRGRGTAKRARWGWCPVPARRALRPRAGCLRASVPWLVRGL